MTGKKSEIIFPITCRGRNLIGKPVLTESVNVKVKVYQSPETDTINSLVDCKYNASGDGDMCEAAKHGRGYCVYRFNIPHLLEIKVK